MKTCTKCKIEKPINKFGRHKRDGRYSWCKKCRAEYQREYQKSKSGKESFRRAHKKYEQSNREKKRAHQTVNYAIKTGKLERQACEVCGAKRAHGHHEDYSKPLEIRWLCNKHHKAHHQQVKGN